MERKSRFEEALLLIMMVIMEGCTVGLNIMAKTVFTNGLNPLVFVTYTHAVATILLLPSFFILHCKHRSKTPILTFSQLLPFPLLGFAGIPIAQNLSYLGLSYSSPILSCAMGHLIPAFSFLLSIILRKTYSDWKCPSTWVKVIGTLMSILGAVLIELYKGPLIRKSSPRLLHSAKVFIFASLPDNWILGGILIAAASFSMALLDIFQVGTATEYTEAIKVAPCYSFLGTIVSAILSLVLVERDLSSWKLKNNMEITVILLLALFGGVIRHHVHLWCTHFKAPTYAPLFKPFSIAYATIFGISFFPNSLHWGSVIGAVIIGMGYYTVFWGRINEEDDRKARVENLDSKVPLLQEQMEV